MAVDKKRRIRPKKLEKTTEISIYKKLAFLFVPMIVSYIVYTYVSYFTIL